MFVYQLWMKDWNRQWKLVDFFSTRKEADEVLREKKIHYHGSEYKVVAGIETSNETFQSVCQSTVFLLWLRNGGGEHRTPQMCLLGMFRSRADAEQEISHHRDERHHPPDLENYVIQEVEIK